MTALDYKAQRPGYYPSVWPVECGGSRRQKLVGSPGLGLSEGERLASTTRHSGGWAVMFVQRGPGEIFLQAGGQLRPGEFPPQYRPEGKNSGWLERVNPITLETVVRSPDLPSGGHLWCGAVVAHSNGDLYMVNGRYCHRLNSDCEVMVERQLPLDAPYNGLLIMSDGNLVMKNLGYRPGEPCQFSVLEPERLEAVSDPLVIESQCMGRFSSDITEGGDEFIYLSSATDLIRLRYENGKLSRDSDWRASYAVEGQDQSDAWDTSIGSDSVWLMDMGRLPTWQTPGSAAQRAFRFSTTDARERDVVDVIEEPNAWNPGPPLYDPERKILVVYDTLNGGVVALRYNEPGSLDVLWKSDARNTTQMMLYADTGELVMEDAPAAMSLDDKKICSEVVIIDIETGKERGRASTDSRSIMGMFLCPGFERDLYVATLPGRIARVFVE